jgi:hypothetical protein
VPRKLVHRAAVSETFLTDAAELGPDRFLVAAQLPRAHALYNDVTAGYHDLLLLAETVRQAGTLVSHQFYGVPESAVFPLRQAQIEVTELDALASAGVASELVADVYITDQQRQSGALSSMNLRARMFLDGRAVGWAGGAMHFVSPSSYGALRRKRSLVASQTAPSAVDRATPSSVGRSDQRNVVVEDFQRPAGDGAYSCRILADSSHPAYFDHPQDHIPGMLLLEAYRQLGMLSVADACGWAPQSLLVVDCDASFSRYAELELEARCHATVGVPTLPRRGEAWVPVSLTVTQQGATLSQAQLRVADIAR